MNGACRASWKLTKGYKLSVGWMQHTVMETTYVPRFQNHKQQKETLPKTLYLTFLILQMLKLERMTYLYFGFQLSSQFKATASLTNSKAKVFRGLEQFQVEKKLED